MGNHDVRNTGFEGSAGNDVPGIARAVKEAGLQDKICVMDWGDWPILPMALHAGINPYEPLDEKQLNEVRLVLRAMFKNTRTLVGRIVSDKRSKTVTVLIERRTAHELYGKIVARSRKYHAHDEKGEYKMGDVVEIAEGRPISKTKSWVVTRLIKKAGLV